MSNTLSVAGWRVAGLRCPDHEISLLEGNEPCPVTLIQMPNGTGKTTTLNLIRAALAGQPLDGPWTRERLLEFRKKDSENERGTFTLSLLFNDKRLTIEMTFDFEMGAAPGYTTTYGSGMQDGHEPPRDLKQFFRPEFVNFFVFDGELATNLLNHQQTRAGKAIENLFQLGLLKSMSGAINTYWMQAVENRGATEEKGFTRRKNKVKSLEALIARRRAGQVDLQERLDQTQQDLKERRQKFSEALDQKEELQERLRQALTEQEKAKADMEACRLEVLDASRNPHALSAVFAREMVAFKESLDRVKLPESTAREFFEELASEEMCICGRPLDEESSAYIRAQASHYLGSDDMILLNQVKKDIADHIGSDPADPELVLKEQIGTLVAQIRRQGEAKTVYEAIVSEGTQDDPELETARELISEMSRKVRSLESDLSKYNQASAVGDDEQILSISELKKRLKEAEEKLDEIRGTIELRKKRETLISLLSEAESAARVGIHSEIRDRTNETIADLMPNNAIRVAEIGNSIRLRGQEAGSMGETLSVGYAFLSTLFNRTEQNKLPFVVDSPAGALDLRVRARAAALIPKLSHQYVAFTISTEREGFLDALDLATGGRIRYVTLFRKGEVALDMQMHSYSGVTQTEDGFCVQGRDFFRNFHLETEPSADAV